MSNIPKMGQLPTPEKPKWEKKNRNPAKWSKWGFQKKVAIMASNPSGVPKKKVEKNGCPKKKWENKIE